MILVQSSRPPNPTSNNSYIYLLACKIMKCHCGSQFEKKKHNLHPSVPFLQPEYEESAYRHTVLPDKPENGLAVSLSNA